MCSKCINFTLPGKSVTGNEFSDIDFLYDIEILAARRCFSTILAIFHCMRIQPYYFLPFKIRRHV